MQRARLGPNGRSPRTTEFSHVTRKVNAAQRATYERYAADHRGRHELTKLSRQSELYGIAVIAQRSRNRWRIAYLDLDGYRIVWDRGGVCWLRPGWRYDPVECSP